MFSYMRPTGDEQGMMFTVQLSLEELRTAKQEPAVILGTITDAVRALLWPPQPGGVPDDQIMMEDPAEPDVRATYARESHQPL